VVWGAPEGGVVGTGVPDVVAGAAEVEGPPPAVDPFEVVGRP